MVKGRCSHFSPAIIDTDGALRWVGTGGHASFVATFFDNAVYLVDGTRLYRNDLDGTFTELRNYSDIGVTFLYDNIDRGKFGIILDADTTTHLESVNIEVDASGRVLKQWNLAAIISGPAMIAGGDDPSQFVFPKPTDWFHNNGVAIIRPDDLSDRFKPRKLSYLSGLQHGGYQMDPGRSDEEVVPISVFEEICAQARARQPASNRPTFAIDHIRSGNTGLR